MYDSPIDMEVLRLCLRQQVLQVAIDIDFICLDEILVFGGKFL